MNETLQSIDVLVSLLEDQFIPKLVVSAVIILTLALIRWIILRAIYTYFQEVRIRYNWRKWTTHIGFLLSAVLIISVWFKEFSSVLTFLGLLSAGIAIALREPVVNFFGWIFLLWRKPFNVGDRIKIGDDIGDVIDIRIFQFSMMEVGAWVNSDQYSGRIVDVPNGRVFTMPQYNYSKQFPLLWNELSFRTTFESDIESVKSIIKIALDLPEIQNSKDDIAKLNDVIENFITYNISADTAIFFKVVENGYQFTFRYLCKFNGRRKTEQIIWESIIKSVNENPNVRFAYPTQRFVSGIDNKIQGQDSYNIV
ncbi:MAG: mechanosensitive ion channel domain-containing protein [Candidatus Kapaibacterium sp.]